MLSEILKSIKPCHFNSIVSLWRSLDKMIRTKSKIFRVVSQRQQQNETKKKWIQKQMINIDTEHQNRSNVDGLNLGTVEKKKNRNNETFFFLLGMITILMNS